MEQTTVRPEKRQFWKEAVMAKFLKYKEYVSRVVLSTVYFVPAYFYAATVRKRPEYSHLWLISERGDEARDNAYHLFRYILDRHAEVNAWFVLTEDSPDIGKLKDCKRLVRPRSFMHFVLFILAEKLISTHQYGAAPYGKGSRTILSLLPRKHHINLKHGVTKDKFSYAQSANDVIVCTSEKEVCLMREISEKPTNAIHVIGFCRFDKLVDRSKEKEEKIILLMPTFRFWLEEASRLTNRDEVFRRDPYFRYWDALLSNGRLQQFCRDKGYRIIFYPHYRSQKYLHNFKDYPEEVIIADNKNYDIQDLLVRASLMVTDFSSVFFDFSYMQKPVVYYQFDEVKYRNLQYKEGEFSYRHDGFGPVFDETEKVVDYIIGRAEEQFRIEEMYGERIGRFFKYHDKNNTKRNFEAITALSRAGLKNKSSKGIAGSRSSSV